jgi:hypothetical protein
MVEGLTHASNVTAVVRCSAAVSGTLTTAELPLNDSAPPYLPAAVQVAFAMLPAFPDPDASATVVPLPSLKAYAATIGHALIVAVVVAVVVVSV